jgi:hypothetical protein
VEPDGSLAVASCVGTPAGCTPAPAGSAVGDHGSGNGVALTRDGRYLYAAVPSAEAIGEYAIGVEGTLTSLGCLGSPTNTAGCATTSPLLGCTEGVAVSGDDADVYATGCNTLLTLLPQAGGALLPQSCIAESGSPLACATASPGLNGPQSIALGPDDSSLFVAAGSGNSIATFTRAPFPPSIAIESPASGATYTRGQSVAAGYSCTAPADAIVTACGGPVASGAPIDTHTLGSHTFTVTATDSAGASGSQTVSYSVLAQPSLAPAITNVTQSNSIWREGKRLAIITKKRPATGTTFSFSLNERAAVSFGFTQRIKGRRAKGKCVGQTEKNRRKPACKRTLTRGTLSFTGHPGENKVVFQGRLSQSKKLRPGRYTLVIEASNSSGHSNPARLTFTIVR